MKNSGNIENGKVETGKVSSEKIGNIPAKTGLDVLQYGPLFGITESPNPIIEYLVPTVEYHITITKRSIDRIEPFIPESKRQAGKDESLVGKDEPSNGCE